MENILIIMRLISQGGLLAEQLMNIFSRVQNGETIPQDELDTAAAQVDLAVLNWDNETKGDNA